MQRSTTSRWTRQLGVAADVSAVAMEVDDGLSHGGFRLDPGRGCTGRTARAQQRICGRAFACCASSALTDSVGAGQVTLSISRSRARMFCYGLML